MLFDLNGNTYQVKFFRRVFDGINPDKPVTIADLLIKDGDEFVNLMVNGIAYCNPKDRFSKSKGRKQALKNLITKLTTNVIGYKIDKEDKRMIWEIYFKEHRK